jgi:hypothetical protein
MPLISFPKLVRTTGFKSMTQLEVPDLVVHPLNLILYRDIHLRIFEYSSNIFMTSFGRIDLKSCSFCERNPV